MSGFLSSDAEAALRGQDEESRRLFYLNQADNARLTGQTSGPSFPQGQQWTPGIGSGMDSAHQAFAAPSQYVSWPSTAWPTIEPNEYGRGQYQAPPTPVVPSTPYSAEPWANAPWPALHPDDMQASSDTSRSVSPNPADLRNFGIPLPDGRSWRCAYANCSSQAVFTRGCDLRKHFRRHTKSLFCRHEDCPQSREGGFSSKKDRDRHEARHFPEIPCSVKGCGRVFSRVDNMKDHVRRIHGKNI